MLVKMVLLRFVRMGPLRGPGLHEQRDLPELLTRDLVRTGRE